MAQRRTKNRAHKLGALLAGGLCVLALLGGCNQRSQIAETAESAAQFETSTTETPAPAADVGEAADAQEQAQASELAEACLDEAEALEPPITEDLKALEDETSSLAGLAFRLKSKESLARKVLLDAHTKEIPLDEAAGAIHDVLRYTLCIEPDDYAAKATEALTDLESKGYDVVKFKNTWDDDLYKGINTQIKAPSGIVFELQIHTPDSFETKESNHVYYETSRAEDATEEEVKESTRLMREATARLEIPEGALELTWE